MRFFKLFAPLPSLVACAAMLVAGCHASGDGTGTAPPESDPCPSFSAVKEGAPCNGATSNAPRICCYVDVDGGAGIACGAAGSGATVAYCAGGLNPDGGAATWDLQVPGDAGTPDTGADASDAADAAETSDASDAADAADASDAADAADASETSDAADASETSDAADDASEAGDADDAG
jgi:hypothetical protein